MDGIAAPVRLVRRRVHRHSSHRRTRLPRLLPRSYSLFEHLDDAVGDLLPEIPFLRRVLGRGGRWSGAGGHCYAPSSPFTNSDSGVSSSKPDPASGSPPIASNKLRASESFGLIIVPSFGVNERNTALQLPREWKRQF